MSGRVRRELARFLFSQAAAVEIAESTPVALPLAPIQLTQHAGRAGRPVTVVPFQDRGHGMTTERRTMTFFLRRLRRRQLADTARSFTAAKRLAA
jgi:hypothetical protein